MVDERRCITTNFYFLKLKMTADQKIRFRKIKVFQPLSYSSIPKCLAVKVENMITYHYGTEEVTPYAGLIFCVWLFNLNSLDFRGEKPPFY